MADELSQLLEANPDAQKYYAKLPQYVKEAARKHGTEIDSIKSLRLFAGTFMEDGSYRGA